MRLIDADEVKDLINSWDSLPFEEEVDELVDRIPTAFDLDKVVEQLGRRYKDCQNGIFKYHEQGNQEMVEICFNRGDAYIDAADIVKAGGKDEDTK